MAETYALHRIGDDSDFSVYGTYRTAKEDLMTLQHGGQRFWESEARWYPTLFADRGKLTVTVLDRDPYRTSDKRRRLTKTWEGKPDRVREYIRGNVVADQGPGAASADPDAKELKRVLGYLHNDDGVPGWVTMFVEKLSMHDLIDLIREFHYQHPEITSRSLVGWLDDRPPLPPEKAALLPKKADVPSTEFQAEMTTKQRSVRQQPSREHSDDL